MVCFSFLTLEFRYPLSEQSYLYVDDHGHAIFNILLVFSVRNLQVGSLADSLEVSKLQSKKWSGVA